MSDPRQPTTEAPGHDHPCRTEARAHAALLEARRKIGAVTCWFDTLSALHGYDACVAYLDKLRSDEAAAHVVWEKAAKADAIAWLAEYDAALRDGRRPPR